MTFNVKTKSDFTSSISNISTIKSSKKFNLNNRITYYKIINKYIKNQNKFDPEKCFKFGKNITKIGSNIIIDKKIGTESNYGIVFLTYYNDKNGKKIVFATKIIDSSKKYNIIESNILKYLTKLNIKYKLCPHFPITYAILNCNNTSVIKNKNMFKHLYNKKLMFIFNELAHDNLYNLMYFKIIDAKILYNALAQIFMAIMFFNKYTNAFHFDGHCGNYLYHKITPGGYFHYHINGEDYYIENIGYLWIIWDFGLIVPFNRNNYSKSLAFIYDLKLPINYDYIKILHCFTSKHFRKIYRSNIYTSFKIINDILSTFNNTFDTNKMPILVSHVLIIMKKYLHNHFLCSIPSNAKVINKIPFRY